MAHTTFDQVIPVTAPFEMVRERLAGLMTNIEELHPLVIWTRHIATTSAPDGTKTDYYRVHDRMKLGPFPVAFTYKVDMTVTLDGRLLFHAYQSPGIHLAATTWCEPAEEGTLIREYVEITAPRPLLKTTYQGALSAHKELFAKLKEQIERIQTPAP